MHTRGTDEKEDKEAAVEYSPFENHPINKFLTRILPRGGFVVLKLLVYVHMYSCIAGYYDPINLRTESVLE